MVTIPNWLRAVMSLRVWIDDPDDYEPEPA
jgi:predicted 2-oxoglutarate/Fe(II)-dependent dioxygenase YbiX